METIKRLGGAALGVAAFIAFIVGAVLLFTLGPAIAFTIQPWINSIAGVVLVINILLLLFAIIPSARRAVGTWYIWSSYLFGVSTWIFGLAVTMSLWGIGALIIGLLLGGIGVVPIGALAAIVHGHWDLFWMLIVGIALTYGIRLIGAGLVVSGEKHDETIQSRARQAIEATIVRVEDRRWEDLQ